MEPFDIAVVRQETEFATSIASGSPTVKIDAPSPPLG